MTHRALVASGFVTLGIASCQPSDTDRTVTVPDGVPVKVATSAAWGADEAWSLEEVVTVGAPDVDFVDVVGIDADEAGRIYVADRGAQHVRVLDAGGSPLATIGAPGEGPGEFGSNVGGVFLLGGEVVVPDVSNQRISRFDPDGRFLGSRRVSADGGVPIRWDVAAGRLVAQRRSVVPGDRTPPPDVVVSLPLEGERVDTLATLPEGVAVQITGGIPRIRQFEPEPMWDTTAEGRFVTAMSDAWHFETRAPDGALEWVATRAIEAAPASGADRRAVEESLRRMYERRGVPPSISGEVIRRMEFADRLPALASLRFGPRDTLWVQHLVPPAEWGDERVRIFPAQMGSRTWSVFGPEGDYLGEVTFPVEFEPLHASGDLWYGITRDQLDVQSVGVFRVVTE